jgi:hypothetical protein
MENLTEQFVVDSVHTTRSKDLRQRRDTYLDLLLNKVREMIKNGTDKPCILVVGKVTKCRDVILQVLRGAT